MPSNTKTSSYDTFPTAEDEESSNTLLTSSAAAAGTTEGGKVEAATVLLLLLPWKNIGMLLSVLGLVISAVALLKNTGNTSRSSSSTSELPMLASSTNEPRCKQATGQQKYGDVCWQAYTDDTFNTIPLPREYCWSESFYNGAYPSHPYFQCKPKGSWKALPQARADCGNPCSTFEYGNVCWQAFKDDTFNTPREPAEHCWTKSIYNGGWDGSYFQRKPMGAWKAVYPRRTLQPGECGDTCAKFETHQCFNNRDELKAAVDTYVSSGCNKGAKVCPDITSKYGWPMNSWCVGKVTDMYELFYDMSTFNEDISSWDVSQVQSMYGTFLYATSFNGDISLWDVSQVQDMTSMFEYASSFNGDLSSWDVSQVKDMSHMFESASSFNRDLSSWDISQVKDMSTMFWYASSFNGDVSLWDVSQVEYMNSMFDSASSFNQDLCAWAKNFPYTKAPDIFANSGCNYPSNPQICDPGQHVCTTAFCASTCK